MKVSDFYVENKKEITSLGKLKLPLKKSTEKLILSKATHKTADFVSLVQLWRGKIIERVFAVRLNRKCKPEYQEVIRRVEGNSLISDRNMYITMMAGTKVVWEDSRPSVWCFNKEKYFNEWFIDGNNIFNVWIKEYLFTNEDLTKLDPSLKYCFWNKQRIIDYVTIYRKYPELEMLSKLGLNRVMYNTAVLKKLKDKNFKKFICMYGGDYNTTGKDLLCAYKHNFKPDDLYKHQQIMKRVSEVLKTYKDIDRDKLYKYFNRYFELNKCHINVQSYKDMLEAEQFLLLDLTLDKNAFPHDFQKWHDHYTKQMRIAKSESIDKRISKRAVRYKKLEMEIEGIKLILPHSTEEFINEGEKLHHCVGRMEYNKKMADGKSLILFVRKIEDITKPYVTMEYDPKTKKIKQMYGDHDSVPEESTSNIINNHWLPKVKKMRFVQKEAVA